MKKTLFTLVPLSILLLVVPISCQSDDNDPFALVPARDRGPEAVASTAIIEEYLETHFYNYEEFANPPLGFDFLIRLDTIAGDNADKIPLIQQVSSKTVRDRPEEDVMYKLYFLTVAQGGGGSINFPDITTVNFEGTYINRETTIDPYTDLFDSSEIPIPFDLTSIVNGLQDALIEFNTAEAIIENPDGSLTPQNPGIGAVFIPSGLGFYASPPVGGGIPLYAQLIFTFQVFSVIEGDQDNDGIPSVDEDLNNNGLEEDDDTDQDGFPDFVDNDDDNDGRPTIDEIEIGEDGVITFPDTDNDGIVDYLDSDS